jgi:hypothetical protein
MFTLHQLQTSFAWGGGEMVKYGLKIKRLVKKAQVEKVLRQTKACVAEND